MVMSCTVCDPPGWIPLVFIINSSSSSYESAGYSIQINLSNKSNGVYCLSPFNFKSFHILPQLQLYCFGLLSVFFVVVGFVFFSCFVCWERESEFGKPNSHPNSLLITLHFQSVNPSSSSSSYLVEFVLDLLPHFFCLKKLSPH